MDNQEQYLRELKSFFWENNISPDIYQLERLAHYAALVVQKNEVINLVSRKDIEKIVENHVFISAFISHFIPDKVTRFLDIGTGGGFPGIPLAIMKPLLKGVLVDSITKKTDSVSEFVKKLKLSNVTIVNDRVESDEFKLKYTNTFDLIVSRATVPLIILLRYSLPVIKEKAVLIALKGGEMEEEFETAELKYKSQIKKSTVFELGYKPTNSRNEKGKKLILLELIK
ncbi:MAG: 16S rRNA (guanine(527)-N(7))-methyltransferase RsmG [bacterium]